MDTQDHTTHSGHDGHGVHLCHRCAWPFPNPHPSAKHRRAHKKICGTIEGYTVLIGSEVVSDDEHHSDDDKEQTPSSKIGEIKGSISRSEDEFADAVTEFVDTGSAKKTLEKDMFFSFKDAESADSNEVLNAPIEINKTITEVSENTDPHVEKTEETEIKTVRDLSESNLELTGTGELVKDSQTSETITEEAKDSEAAKRVPEVSAIVDGSSDEIKQEIKSDCENVSETVKESETVEAIKIGKFESDHKHVLEVAKESEIAEKVNLDEPNEPIQEVVKESVAVLTERKDLELEKSSIEQIQEAVNEPVAVLIEKEDLSGPHVEKQSIEHTHEVIEKPDSVLTEKEQIQEVVSEPVAVLIEKEDIGGPHLEKQSKEHTKLETCLKDEVIEQEVNNDHNLVADVSTETVTLKDSSDDSVKDASGIVTEPIVEECNGKLVNNQDSGADVTVDSSSHNSLEGTWGSVSVLSTASTDAETLHITEKSKVNSEKSNAATSDVCEPPSLMTLVEPESKDNKLGSSEVQDSQQPPNSESSQAGLTEVNNKSEGRKKNEEAMPKVTNLSTGKQSTPLKNLLGEAAKSPGGKQPEPVAQKDEPLVNDEASSPPKLIEDGKKVKKKGRSSWVPFVCCSSINAVK